jgi:hypothetical protein
MKYKGSFILGVLLLGTLILSYFYLNEYNFLINTIIGLLFSIPISLFWLEYKIPILQIKKGVEIRITDFNCEIGDDIKLQIGLSRNEFGDFSPQIIYKCIRIIIENVGKTAAKDCKAYIVTSNGKERICWTVPTERTEAKINVNDNERLDFCAFPIVTTDNVTWDNKKIIIPHENGWNNSWVAGLFECKVLVTSENAEPIEANIKINYKENTIEIE